MPRILKLSTKSCHWRQPCIGTWQIVSSRCTKPAEERFYFVKYLLVVSAVDRLELPRPTLGRAPPPEHWAASAMVTMLVPEKHLQCSLHGIIYYYLWSSCGLSSRSKLFRSIVCMAMLELPFSDSLKSSSGMFFRSIKLCVWVLNIQKWIEFLGHLWSW